MEIRKDLPKIFNDFAEARQNAFLAAKEQKEGNRPLIGQYCTFMPQELAIAMDAAVVGLCSTSDETITESEKELPKNLCPLIKSSYGFGKTDKCPFFYFSDLVVGETTCDGKKKMYEIMEEFKPVYIMQLPNNPTSEDSLALWKAEIIKFKEYLEKFFNVEITEEKVRKGIRLRNEERKALKELFALQKTDPPMATGHNLFKVLYGSQYKFDKEVSVKELKDAVERIRDEYKDESNRLPKKHRILLTGCPIGGVTEKVIEAIENSNAYVIYYENCTGGKAVEELVDEDSPDVYDALARKYINIGCSVMSPNPRRHEHIKQVIKDYKIDGVVDMILSACHTYNVETYAIKKTATEAGVPYIAVETDYSNSDTGQINTRIAAFTEML